MNRIIFSLKYILGACILTLLGGCYDDTFGYLNGDMADGEVTVSLDACFEPFGEADLTRTMSGGTKGDCMKGLDDLCLLLYDSEGNLVDGYPREITGYKESDEDRTKGDGAYTDRPIAEAKTKHAEFTASIPAGAYYMVAVANLGYTSGGTTHSTYQALVSGKYAGKYSTLHDLRMMKIAWDAETVANNRAMLGYFDSEKSSNPNAGSSFPLIRIANGNTRLKAWLRRCVSKITVDIDGSALRDNVYVFIKDVKVKNLVKECNLGFGQLSVQSDNPIIYNNAASKEDELLDEALDKQVITFGEGDDFNKWPLITNGTPYITEEVLTGETADGKAAKPRLNLHTETSPALFFFENMQGNSPYPKVSTADPSNNGRPTGSSNPKYDCDGLPCGTYIEVTAHYRSMNYDNVGEGEIKYRFMIGKDADRNCDAERNSHFKLTLKLRGNANNYEWHVDYKDSQGFDAPNPWYVSYLYNHSSQLPFKYTPPAGYEVVKMEATIIDNPWYPTRGDNGEVVYPAGDEASPYSNPNNQYNGNGFLALHSPMSEKTTTMRDGKIVTVEDIGTDWPGYSASAKNYNDAFFYGTGKSKSTIDKSHRVYSFNDATPDATNTGIESYSYKKEHDQFLDVDKYTFSIPLFTREKVLVKRTGYSGNNPFEPYTRTAKLELKATIRNKDTGAEETKKDTIDVIQVKRLVNPKGVYREKGHNQDFHVILMERDGLDAKKFHETTSDGPWRAEIIGDQGFITLDGKQTVTGATRTAIDFNIRFNKTNSKNSPNKYAIVRVLYNNYTCTHLIFVRQGYDEEELSPSAINKFGTVANPAKWSPFNMIADKVPATDPRDEGSLFRYGNLSQPIDAINNVYNGDSNGDGDVLLQSYEGFVEQGPFKIAGTKEVLDDGSEQWTTLSWENITHNSTGFGDDSDVAGVHDFEQLYLTPYIQFGYGVLYADGATETKTDVLEVFGYNRYAPNTAVRGMRGVFAYFYNANEPKKAMTGRNLFFPIGRSAYGHRKNGKVSDKGVKSEIVLNKGILRYCSSRYGEATSLFSDSAPLFSSLYRREGAIYWAAAPVKYPDYLTWNGKPDEDGSASVAYGLDFNFFTFDVNTISGSNVVNGADACFVRCVKKID